MRNKYFRIQTLLLIHLFISLSLLAQPGTLVPSFGDQGSVIINFEGRISTFNTLALGKNGEIIAGGNSRIGGNFSPSHFVVAKFDSAGQLVENFGNNGILRDSLLNSANHIIESMTLDKHDNIYVGLSLSTENFFQAHVLRFDSIGNLDTGFADQGIYTSQDAKGPFVVHQLLVDNEGRLLVAADNGVIATVTRLEETGAEDSTFGESGTMYLMDQTRFFRISDIALLSDGKILGTGYSYSQNLFSTTMYKATKDGQLDSSYGSTGIVFTKLNEFGGTPTDMFVAEDGKVLLTGFKSNGSFNDAFFLKYNANGQLDSTFGNNGMYVFSSDRGKEMYGVHVLPDQTILGVGGRAMIRLNAQGRPDSTWGENGILDIPNEFILAMRFVSEDEFIVAGTLTRDFYLGKYTTKDLSTATYHQESPEKEVKVFQNPFSESLNIQYHLNQDSEISVELYDIMGRKVQTLLAPVHRLHGYHYDEFRIDATLSKGPYFLRCSFDKSNQIIKVIKQ